MEQFYFNNETKHYYFDIAVKVKNNRLWKIHLHTFEHGAQKDYYIYTIDENLIKELEDKKNKLVAWDNLCIDDVVKNCMNVREVK